MVERSNECMQTTPHQFKEGVPPEPFDVREDPFLFFPDEGGGVVVHGHARPCTHCRHASERPMMQHPYDDQREL